MKRRFALFALAGLLLAATYGRISGTIKDSAGTVVAGARVSLTNRSTGAKSAATSDKKGNYTFLTVPAGVYDLEVTAAGLKLARRNGITVHVDSAVKIDLALELE